MASNKTVASGKCGALTLIKNSDSKVKLFTSGSNTFALNVSGDETFAKFAGNDKVKFISNVKSDISLEMEVFSMPLLSVMFGFSGTTGVTDLFTNDLFLTPTTTLTLSNTPVSGSVYVSKMETGDTESLLEGGEIELGDNANVGEYEITGSTITLNAGDLASPIRVFYRKASASTATKYDFNAQLATAITGYTLSFVFDWTDANNGVAVPMQLTANNLQPSISTGISFSAGSVANITMNANLLPDSLGNNFSMVQI